MSFRRFLFQIFFLFALIHVLHDKFIISQCLIIRPFLKLHVSFSRTEHRNEMRIRIAVKLLSCEFIFVQEEKEIDMPLLPANPIGCPVSIASPAEQEFQP